MHAEALLLLQTGVWLTPILRLVAVKDAEESPVAVNDLHWLDRLLLLVFSPLLLRLLIKKLLMFLLRRRIWQSY
jgi:hypothetical protein